MQIEAMNIVGEIRGKHCIIVDDMIDTAGNNLRVVHLGGSTCYAISGRGN